MKKTLSLAILALLVVIAILPEDSQATLVAPSGSTAAKSIAPNGINSPVSIISVWGGARESIVLKSDGTVWTFGLNDCSSVLGSTACSKLGDSTPISRSIPVQVHGPGNVGYLTSVIAVMGGEHDNHALRSDGTVWSWGANFFGQLGNGTYTNSVAPVQVNNLVSVTALGGRGYHMLAIKSDGTVWAWGFNSQGQLGVTTTITSSNVPVQVIGVNHPLTVTGGGFFSLALMSDHTLKAWGENSLGELGDGTTIARSAPVNVSSILSNVVQVSAGWKHAVALTADGKVWTWGNNSEGAIGNGVTSTAGVTTPYQVPGLSNVILVSGGDRFTGALKSDGTVWTWGAMNDSTQFGQLGDGTFIGKPSPVQVLGLSNVVNYTARDYHNLAVKSDGSVWAWGSGGYGELGNNKFADSNVPVRVLFPNPALYLPLVVR